MDRTKLSGSKGLAIRLDNAQEAYKPGDIISGHVFRQVPVLVGEKDVTVTLRFGGHSYVHMYGWLDNTPESDVEREATFELIDPTHSTQTLHKGPLGIPRTIPGLSDDALEDGAILDSAGKWWPFTVVVPRHTSASATIDDMFHQQGLRKDESVPEYVNIDEDRMATAIALLPSTTVCGTGKPGFGVVGLNLSGCVDYFIEARLVSGRSNNKPMALMSLKVTPATEPIPSVLLSSAHRCSQTLKFTSSRLSKEALAVLFEINTSAVCSLQGETPLSLVVSASCPTPPAKPLDIAFKSLTITVEETASLWAGPDYMSRGEDSYTAVYRPQQFTPETPGRLIMPINRGAVPVDLGQLFDVRLDKVVKVCQNPGNHSRLLPDFATYNIKLSHKLVWDINVAVDGISRVLAGKAPIVIT